MKILRRLHTMFHTWLDGRNRGPVVAGRGNSAASTTPGNLTNNSGGAKIDPVTGVIIKNTRRGQ